MDTDSSRERELSEGEVSYLDSLGQKEKVLLKRKRKMEDKEKVQGEKKAFKKENKVKEAEAIERREWPSGLNERARENAEMLKIHQKGYEKDLKAVMQPN